jgi:hypothetical protein
MKKSLLFSALLLAIFTYLSCSKSNPEPAPNPCAGITVGVTGVVVNASTGVNNGSITASATGGSGFTYNLNGGAFQATGAFTGLAAGTYTIVAKNSSGCTGSAQFTVGATNPCAGITVSVTGTVTDATVANNDGSITVAATGGTTYTYSINGGAFQASNIFNGLSAGAYTVTAKTQAGCTGSAVFNVTNPCSGVTVAVTATVTNTQIGLNNGSINAAATGGTGFNFSINSGPFQATGLFSNLAAGNYTITAKNSNGCTGSATFTVNTINPCTGVTITVTNTITSATPCTTPANGGIAVSATGGTAPYTYNRNGGAFQSSNIFNGLAAGTYSIIAKDANGCTSAAVNATVTNAATGPLFNAVKAVLASNCAISGCHISPNPQNGLDWTIDCTIVANSDRIKARAVDGNPSFMPPAPNPPLSATDKQKIVNWVNAGADITD